MSAGLWQEYMSAWVSYGARHAVCMSQCVGIDGSGMQYQSANSDMICAEGLSQLVFRAPTAMHIRSNATGHVLITITVWVLRSLSAACRLTILRSLYWEGVYLVVCSDVCDQHAIT